MADNDNGSNNVAIIAILIIALLAIGGFFWSQGYFTGSDNETTVIEREIIREEPASEPEPAPQEDDSDFSFEFEDEEGNKTTIEGNDDSQ